MIERIVVAICAFAALVLAIAFEYAALDLWLHATDRAPALVPCALGALMLWLTVDLSWGARRPAPRRPAPTAPPGEEAPALVD